jgi:hypothetical protein
MALADVVALPLATERALFVVQTGPHALLAPILALHRRNLLYLRHLCMTHKSTIM